MKVSIPDRLWAISGQQIIEALDSFIQSGLSDSEVKRRRQEYGPNRLRQAERRSAWAILLDQFKSLIVLLLTISAVLSH